MKLSHDEATQQMHTIKQLLAKLGLTDVSVEYPAYLSIVIDGREYHAGFAFEDEENDATEFQVYNWNDGLWGDELYEEFETQNDLGFIAKRIAFFVVADYAKSLNS